MRQLAASICVIFAAISVPINLNSNGSVLVAAAFAEYAWPMPAVCHKRDCRRTVTSTWLPSHQSVGNHLSTLHDTPQQPVANSVSAGDVLLKNANLDDPLLVVDHRPSNCPEGSRKSNSKRHPPATTLRPPTGHGSALPTADVRTSCFLQWRSGVLCPLAK